MSNDHIIKFSLRDIEPSFAGIGWEPLIQANFDNFLKCLEWEGYDPGTLSLQDRGPLIAFSILNNSVSAHLRKGRELAEDSFNALQSGRLFASIALARGVLECAAFAADVVLFLEDCEEKKAKFTQLHEGVVKRAFYSETQWLALKFGFPDILEDVQKPYLDMIKSLNPQRYNVQQGLDSLSLFLERRGIAIPDREPINKTFFRDVYTDLSAFCHPGYANMTVSEDHVYSGELGQLTGRARLISRISRGLISYCYLCRTAYEARRWLSAMKQHLSQEKAD